jgi:hypothetical protein
MMAQILKEILTALYDGLVAFGLGIAGLPYEIPRTNRDEDNN